MEQIQIIDAKKHIGEIVQIGAWVANKRSSGKIAFLQLRDGTAYFQGIVVKNEVGEEIFQIAKNLHQETSVMITGEIREDSRSKFGYEIGIQGIEVIGRHYRLSIPRKRTKQSKRCACPRRNGTDTSSDLSQASSAFFH